LIAAGQGEAPAFDDEAIERNAAFGDLKAPARQIDGAVSLAHQRQGGTIDAGKREPHATTRQAGERHLELKRLADQSGRTAGAAAMLTSLSRR